MKFLFSSIAFIVFGSVSAAETTRSDALAWTYQYVLATSRSATQLEPVFKEIETSPALRDKTMMDFLAELLLQRSADRNYPAENVTALVNILTGNKDGRYRTVLDRKSAFDSIPGVQSK